MSFIEDWNSNDNRATGQYQKQQNLSSLIGFTDWDFACVAVTGGLVIIWKVEGGWLEMKT